jgi:hypothetical protein
MLRRPCHEQLGARDPDNVLQAEIEYVCKEAW